MQSCIQWWAWRQVETHSFTMLATETWNAWLLGLALACLFWDTVQTWQYDVQYAPLHLHMKSSDLFTLLSTILHQRSIYFTGGIYAYLHHKVPVKFQYTVCSSSTVGPYNTTNVTMLMNVLNCSFTILDPAFSPSLTHEAHWCRNLYYFVCLFDQYLCFIK